MKNTDKKRLKQIVEDVKSMQVDACAILNNANNEILPLKEHIYKKLLAALREDDCSSNQSNSYYSWFLESLVECKGCKSSILSVLQTSYTNTGEAYSDESFSFYAEAVDDDFVVNEFIPITPKQDFINDLNFALKISDLDDEAFEFVTISSNKKRLNLSEIRRFDKLSENNFFATLKESGFICVDEDKGLWDFANG